MPFVRKVTTVVLTRTSAPPARAAAVAALVVAGLLGASVAPATAAPVAHEFALSAATTTSSFGYYNYEMPEVAPDVTTLSLQLPAEVNEITPVDAFYYVDNNGIFIDGTTSITGGVATLDIGALDLNPGDFIAVGIEIWDAERYTVGASSRGVNAYFSIGAENGSQSTATLVFDDATPYYTAEGVNFEFGGDPLVVAPGDTITFTAAAGYFSTGPDGTWDPAETLTFGSVYGLDAESFADAQIAPDGSSMTITVPRPHWAFDPGSVLTKYGNAYQEFTDISGNFIGYDVIDIGLAVTYAPVADPTVERVSGADRFTVAQNIAQQSYPDGAEVVYVTNGLNYPDALSAAPAAAFAGGPLLLTLPFALPAGLADTITAIDPNRIIVVGGVNSVNETVYAELSALVGGNIERLGGADRFAASRNLTLDAFGTAGAPVAYLATGLNFPDALSASAAAGAIGAPVILINGTLSSLDSATLQLLETLGTEIVYIAGGPNSVSNGILSSLDTAGFIVDRLSGSDRFEASSNIARNGFLTANRAFIATGFNFPDALAGAAWAASTGSPLIVIPGTCIPARVLSDLENYQVSEVTILGGPNSVSTAVENLTPCAGFAWPVQAEALGSADAPVSSAPGRIDRITERITAGR